MNTIEYAQHIRTTLKSKHSITSRQVSVKTELFAGGSAINITIKDPSVSFDLVNELAHEAESIRRCEITGDILNGGNRYVSVRHAR